MLTTHPLTQKILAHVRIPLYRNAYAWMFSTGLSSVLGIVYWVVAAWVYSAESLGLNAALISAMMFLSGVSQLNLMSALIRFIPTAGQATTRFVLGTYALSMAVAAPLSLLLTYGLDALALTPDILTASPRFMLWFIMSTMTWCVFNLQDSVLTGLRDALWVPIENTSYAILKIVLLLLFVRIFPDYGIFASWILPVFLAIVPINGLIFRKLIPNHIANTQAHAQPLESRAIVAYVASNYIAALFLMASTRLLPVIVTGKAGDAAGAYFYMAWTMANAIKLVVINMNMSLTVEGARDNDLLRKNSIRFLISVARIIIPAALFLVVAAPFILRVSGGNYSAEGTTALRLMALSVIPSIISLLYISIARVQNRNISIILVQGLLTTLILTLSIYLLPRMGITGVGLAMLISETVVAVVVIVKIYLWRLFS